MSIQTDYGQLFTYNELMDTVKYTTTTASRIRQQYSLPANHTVRWSPNPAWNEFERAQYIDWMIAWTPLIEKKAKIKLEVDIGAGFITTVHNIQK